MFILVICCGYIALITQKKKKENSWKPFCDSYIGPQSLVDN